MVTVLPMDQQSMELLWDLRSELLWD